MKLLHYRDRTRTSQGNYKANNKQLCRSLLKEKAIDGPSYEKVQIDHCWQRDNISVDLDIWSPQGTDHLCFFFEASVTNVMHDQAHSRWLAQLNVHTLNCLCRSGSCFRKRQVFRHFSKANYLKMLTNYYVQGVNPVTWRWTAKGACEGAERPSRSKTI
jgi:hypothetical protein